MLITCTITIFITCTVTIFITCTITMFNNYTDRVDLSLLLNNNDVIESTCLPNNCDLEFLDYVSRVSAIIMLNNMSFI